ncbi:MAG: glycosyltransferase [Betaproteobacteria bacterium]|nr:glycosyltransferase [Betaproteobacteria bacterium]
MKLMERALTSQGIEVETATTDDDGYGCRDGVHGRDPSRENGVIRRYFPLRLRLYKVSPAFATWIHKHVRDYDLLHIHSLFSFTSTFAAIAARRSGTPYIIRPLGTLNSYGVSQRRPWLKRLSLFLVDASILRNASAVHFTSEAERLEAGRLGIPMRGAVVPLGVDVGLPVEASIFLEKFPQLRHGQRILFLSRLDPKKNVEGLLRAFSLCRREMRHVSLVIAGDGPSDYVARLKARSIELGLSESVLWTGHLDGELKSSAFAAADVFVLPSFSENFGIAAVEALMAGLPCVLGRGVALAAKVAEAKAGLLVEPTAESIAQGLSRILTDEPGRKAMAANAVSLARNAYSIEAMGAGLASLYERLVSPAGKKNPMDYS